MGWDCCRTFKACEQRRVICGLPINLQEKDVCGPFREFRDKGDGRKLSRSTGVCGRGGVT